MWDIFGSSAFRLGTAAIMVLLAILAPTWPRIETPVRHLVAGSCRVAAVYWNAIFVVIMVFIFSNYIEQQRNPDTDGDALAIGTAITWWALLTIWIVPLIGITCTYIVFCVGNPPPRKLVS